MANKSTDVRLNPLMKIYRLDTSLEGLPKRDQLMRYLGVPKSRLEDMYEGAQPPRALKSSDVKVEQR